MTEDNKAVFITTIWDKENPDGIIECSNENWLGIAYKIPNTPEAQEEAKKIPYLQKAGIYFLFGKSAENDNHVGTVYVGRAEPRGNKGDKQKALLNRINEYHKNLPGWTEAVLFTTKEASTLTGDELGFLEHTFDDEVKSSKRYTRKNRKSPQTATVSPAYRDKVKTYVNNVKLILALLGYKVFIPNEEDTTTSDELTDNTTNIGAPTRGIIFHMTDNSTDAYGTYNGMTFTLCKGSRVNPTMAPKCPPYIVNRRNKFSNLLDKNFTLKEDHPFDTPAEAATFVVGGSINARDCWKDENGVSLGELFPIKTKPFTTAKAVKSVPNNKTSSSLESKYPIFYITSKGVHATGILDANGQAITVCRGSIICPNITKDSRGDILKIRKKYADKVDDNFTVIEDIPFKKTSTAAKFVLGSSANGFKCWHDKNNHTLDEIVRHKS